MQPSTSRLSIPNLVQTGARRQRKRTFNTFQKKLIVFDYMGEHAPKSFTSADKRICLRGLLPPISVDTTEHEISSEITAVLRDYSPDLNSEYEFINMNIPNQVLSGMVALLKNWLDQEVFMLDSQKTSTHFLRMIFLVHHPRLQFIHHSDHHLH